MRWRAGFLPWCQRHCTAIGFSVFLLSLVPLLFLDTSVRGYGTFWAVVGAVVATLFVGLYGSFAHWRRHPDGTKNHAGQHLMSFTAALSAILWLVVLSALGVIPREWGPYLRAVIFVTVAFLLIWRLWLLIAKQRATRRRLRVRAVE